MIEISALFIVSVFTAGILMFLAPCTLPLVPAYLAFISGVKTDANISSELRGRTRHTFILNGVMFVLGFTTIFVSFGLLAGLFGTYVGNLRQILSQIGGVFIILFGLLMLNVIKIDVLRTAKRVPVPSVLTPGHPSSAFGIGAFFALGWTPCVGPILASVLLLASTSTTALEGGILLLVFSLGLGVPFILTALLYSKATEVITNIASLTTSISYIGGVFLILLGVLLLMGDFGLTVQYGYTLFELIGFEWLFDYL